MANAPIHGIQAAASPHAPGAWHIKAGVERVPLATQIDLTVGMEILRVIGNNKTDVRKMA